MQGTVKPRLRLHRAITAQPAAALPPMHWQGQKNAAQQAAERQRQDRAYMCEYVEQLERESNLLNYPKSRTAKTLVQLFPAIPGSPPAFPPSLAGCAEGDAPCG